MSLKDPGREAPTRGLDVVLEHLAARSVALAHAPPDTTRDPADHRILRVHPVAEEEAEVGEVVDRHPARGNDDRELLASVNAS
jgi:hypothetical protein